MYILLVYMFIIVYIYLHLLPRTPDCVMAEARNSEDPPMLSCSRSKRVIATLHTCHRLQMFQDHGAHQLQRRHPSFLVFANVQRWLQRILVFCYPMCNMSIVLVHCPEKQRRVRGLPASLVPPEISLPPIALLLLLLQALSSYSIRKWVIDQVSHSAARADVHMFHSGFIMVPWWFHPGLQIPVLRISSIITANIPSLSSCPVLSINIIMELSSRLRCEPTT